MNLVVDSTGWLEVFANGPLQSEFTTRISNAALVLVPSVVLYEVYKILRREVSEELAEVVAASLQQYAVVDLNVGLALGAADVSLERRLPMADSIIYATAQLRDATLVTSDAHFAGLPGVEYLPRPESEGGPAPAGVPE